MDTELLTNWAGGLLLAAIVVGTPAACSVHTSNLKAQAISEGADPIAADCAFSGPMSDGGTRCILAAARPAQGSKEKP